MTFVTIAEILSAIGFTGYVLFMSYAYQLYPRSEYQKIVYTRRVLIVGEYIEGKYIGWYCRWQLSWSSVKNEWIGDVDVICLVCAICINVDFGYIFTTKAEGEA